ncbi:MAG: branched-chain amino acid ABC transporter ATP-binding protein/permease [Anaerolineales bacterium]|nr:branched-chain amino acid ABC transporter ATP-binding protein/permease [Anaerolineales bacterium]
MQRWEFLAFVTIVGLLAAAIAIGGNPYVLSVLNFIGIFSVAVMGIVLILGYAGQVVLGHAAFMGIGAYTTAIMTLKFGWPAPLGVVSAIVVVAVVAYLAGKPILRLKGFYLALATMALAVVVDSVLVGWSEMTEGPSGMTGIGPFSVGPLRIVGEWPNFLMIYIIVAGALALTLNISRSMVGIGLRVLHRDEELATSLGVNVSVMKTAAFVLSATFAGIAGAIYTHYSRFISPDIFSLHASFDMLLVAMLGGVWTPYGAIIGAALLKFLPEALGAFRDYRIAAYGIIFIAITFYLPNGIAGWIRDVAEMLRRKKPGIPALVMGEILADTAAAGAIGTNARPASLEVAELSKSFIGLRAVADVGFSVPPNQITALIGPNGAGKSTTVNLISGLFMPDQGRITLDGVDLVGQSADAIARMGVARTFQNVRLLGDMTVLENVMAGYCARADLAVWRALARPRTARQQFRTAREEAMQIMEGLGIARYADQPARELPFGLQRVAEIARALITRPRLLLVDEPAAGLNDAETVALGALLKRLAASGITILLIEHNMRLVQAVADSIVVLHHGQLLAAGAPTSVLRNQEVIEAYLGGVPAHVGG